MFPDGVKNLARFGWDRSSVFRLLHKHWANFYVADQEKFLMNAHGEEYFSRMCRLDKGFDRSLAKPDAGRTRFSGTFLYILLNNAGEVRDFMLIEQQVFTNFWISLY
ncbi:MAG: hypothetical protein ACI9N9_001369 [Enterobacterales bacterium]